MAQQTTRYRIGDLVGAYALTAALGQQVYEHIRAEIAAGGVVELDFSEVQIITPLFVTAAIGPFLQTAAPTAFRSQVHIIHLRPIWTRMVERLIDDTYRYHHDPVYAEAIRNVRFYKMSEGGYGMDSDDAD